MRKNGGSFTRGTNRVSTSSSRVKSAGDRKKLYQFCAPFLQLFALKNPWSVIDINVTGLFKSSTKKFPNFDLVTSKRTSRSDEGPLDEAYGVYGLASDEEIDLSGGNNLSWGNRRSKRNKVEGTKKVNGII